MESTVLPPSLGYFSPAETDLYTRADRKLLVAINRETGRFIAQQAENCVSALVVDELTAEQLELLTRIR